VTEEIQAETVTKDPDKLSQDQTARYTSLHAGDRILLWKIAWENWLRYPLIGTGGDTYAIVYEQEKPEGAQDSLYAHSIWMDLLSDTGVFAFLAFATFSVGVLAVAAYNALYKKRSRRSQALIAGSAGAITAYLISSSIDWNWYIPASTLPFFALAAVATGMTRRNRKERPATTP
jgi:O-antigen ligase